MTSLQVHRLGLMAYQTCLNLQKQYHQEVVSRERSDTLLSVEHPNVITMGRHASMNHVTASLETLRDANIPLVETDRGGEVTAHEPGQMVMYPIISLQDRRASLGPRGLVQNLENSVIDVLRQFGLSGVVRPQLPGVWIHDDRGWRKIASLGLRVERRVSYHGLALNVINPLTTFRMMNPCGIDACMMTSMRHELPSNQELNPEEVEKKFIAHFLERMNCI